MPNVYNLINLLQFSLKNLESQFQGFSKMRGNCLFLLLTVEHSRNCKSLYERARAVIIIIGLS